MAEKTKTEHPQIFSLMGQILNDVERIQKTRRNKEQGYSFRGIDEVYAAIHPLFAKYGVFTLPRVLEKESSERVTAKGTILRFTELKIAYDFCAPDGSMVTAEVVGEAMDSGDKSSNKAMSAAQKYAILQTFCIPTGDQPDADSTTPEELKPAQSCPQCHETQSVIKGKPEYGGGWLCFKKKGGCGATWPDDSETAEAPQPAPSASLDDTAMNALREQIKAAMQALNEAGDTPEWTVQRVNEMSKEHFGAVAAKLNLDKLGQLAEMFSQRLEAIRKDSTQGPNEAGLNRKATLATIQAKYSKVAINQALKDTYPDRDIGSLSVDELLHLEEEIIPF